MFGVHGQIFSCCHLKKYFTEYKLLFSLFSFFFSLLTATLYKCDVLAAGECSLCVNLNYTRPYLECFWCQNSCSHSSSCKQHYSVTCPAPRIESVSVILTDLLIKLLVFDLTHNFFMWVIYFFI